MTGAGREEALDALLRAGVACTDSLPVGLIGAAMARSRTRVSVVTVDARQGETVASDALPRDVRVVFLDAGDDVLVRRMYDTSMPHPCIDAGNGRAAVAAERKLLAALRGVAEVVVDTSDLSGPELGHRVAELIVPGGTAAERARFLCTVSSFGFKHGPPLEADWVVDVRFLPNPFWVPELRPLTGLDGAVSRFVVDSQEGTTMLDRLTDLLRWVASQCEAQGRHRLHVAVGCTGGRHRSVAVAVALAERLHAAGVDVAVRHRDVGRPDPR